MAPRRVTLYTRVGCHLCEAAEALLEDVREELPFELHAVDIDQDASLRARYGREVPVVLLDGDALFRHRVDADALRDALRARGAG